MFAFVNALPVLTARPTLRANVTSFHGTPFTAARLNLPATLHMSLESLQERIQAEIKNARETSDKFGKSSKEAAVAWDTVEELEAEASHMKAKNKGKDVLDAYCEENPEADECRTYDT